MRSPSPNRRKGRQSRFGRPVSRDRSRSPFSRGSRWKSERRNSPRPDRSSPAKIDPRKIKIILPINQAGRSQTGSIWHHTKRVGSMEQGLLRSSEGSKGFQGAELEEPNIKSLKKIQIEIRRNIPKSQLSNVPVTRSLRDSIGGLFIPRQPLEGTQPIFDREEIRELVEESSKRVISLERSRSRSPNRRPPRLYSDGEARSRIKDRLGNERSDRDIKSRLGSDSRSTKHVKSRLGARQDDDNRVLGRDELERLRAANSSMPWDNNPEFVPKGRGYFEHDNREDFEDRERGSFNRKRLGARGGFRNKFDRKRGNGFQRRNRNQSPDWKHDKFEGNEDAEQLV